MIENDNVAAVLIAIQIVFVIGVGAWLGCCYRRKHRS